MTTPPPFEKALDEALTKHLHEIKAGHDSKLKQAITAAHEADVLAAEIKTRLDELTILSLKIPENSEAGSLIKERAAILLKAALQSQGEEERLSKEDELNETEDILHEGVSEGLYEVAEDNPGSTRYKLTNYGSVEAERIIAEKGLPFLVMVSSRKAIDDGKNRTVKSMADEIIRNFPNKLKREAKKNFALFWGEFASWSPEKYLEAYEQAQE